MIPEIVKYQADHLIDLMEITDAVSQRAVAIERHISEGRGLGWSAILDGRCIGYVAAIDEGEMMTIWLTVSHELLKRPLWFHKASKRLYKQIKDHANGKPIQILCDKSNAAALKWAWAMGFKCTTKVVMEAA